MAEKFGSPLLRAVIVCGEGLLTGCECDLLGPPFVVVGLLVVGCWLLVVGPSVKWETCFEFVASPETTLVVKSCREH